MLIIGFVIKGTVHKEFVLEGQMINPAYYCGVLERQHENVQRLRPEVWQKRNC
jgi:hypothetical protein